MGDFQFWLYVIIAVIYLVSRLRKKPGQEASDVPASKPERRRRHEEVEPETGEQPMTFEELLREITQGKVEKKPEPVPSREYTKYREEAKAEVIESEGQDLEDVEYDYRKQDSIYEKYEEAKRQAFSRQSLEETMDINKTDVSFGKFREFELEQKRNLMEEYLIDFNDPVGLKRAIVMGEILQRKF